MVRASRGGLVPLGSLLLLLAAEPGSAQCVGDCSGDGEVTINELILGVNIALGTTPVSACPAFANERGEVNIAQLIRGVNNALNGCPEPVATATASSTATGVAATPTSTATSAAATATATASAVPPTATSVATATATGVATATATGIPTGTATATATATGVPTGTATAVATATATGTPTGTATAIATATGDPTRTATATTVATATATSVATATTVPATATATPPATATHTVPPTATHTAVATNTATASVTSSATATATKTIPPTVTATATPTASPTETAVPPGEAVGGRAAYISAGLGGIQALVAAVVTAATNDGGAALVSTLPPPIDTDQCSISGETTQSCTEMGAGAGKTIHLVLGANQCVVPGPLGGTGEFDGSITIDSNPFIFNDCSPLAFLSAAYDVTNLTVMLRDPMDIGTTVAADLNGDVAITGVSPSCLVGSLSLSVNGTLSSTLMDGSGVEVEFFDTGVTMTNITYSADCVPLIYTLTFNGDAAFTPIAAMPPALTSGVLSNPQFDVSFINFVMKQNATTSPVTVEMDGTLASGCLGGQFIMDTLAPMAIAAGQLCPNAGQVSVTGSGNSKATVTYQSDMSVTVTPQGGQPTNYPSCLVEELQMCVPA